MTVSRHLTSYFLLAGAVQIIVGVYALIWAWPLFADPPFLGNGLVKEYSQVQGLLSDNSAMAQTLSALRFKLEWLFNRHTEGLLLALGLGVIFVVLGLVSVLLGVRQRAVFRKQHKAHA